MSIVTTSSLKNITSYFSAIMVLVATLGLAACGGGGDSSDPKLSINNPIVLEGDENTTDVVFTVTLNEKASSTFTVDVATIDGTATSVGNDADFTPVNQTLTIAKGSRSASFTVYVNGDTEIESHETFTLSVSNPQGLKLDASTQSLTATATITNDETVDPKGYFKGTATLNGTEYSDMTALIYGSRVLMFSPAANVLYDINLNNPDSLDYEGTVDLYVDGLLAQADSIKVSGKTSNIELSGSISGGTGFGVGSFEVAFDADNNTGAGADFSRIEAPTASKWTGDFYSVDTVVGQLFFLLEGRWGGSNNQVPACQFPSGVGVMSIPAVETNIFQLFNEVKDLVNCNYAGTGYTGFASVINVSGTDDGLLLALTNGSYAVFSIMDRPTP